MDQATSMPFVKSRLVLSVLEREGEDRCWSSPSLESKLYPSPTTVRLDPNNYHLEIPASRYASPTASRSSSQWIRMRRAMATSSAFTVAGTSYHPRSLHNQRRMSFSYRSINQYTHLLLQLEQVAQPSETAMSSLGWWEHEDKIRGLLRASLLLPSAS